MRKTCAIAWVAVALIGLSACQTFQGSDQPAQLSQRAGWKGAAPNSEKAFKFVVLSDRTGGHDPGVFEAAVDQVNLLKPDFVMCVGDLIEGYSDDDAKINSMWDEWDGIISKLDAPFFYCPGNHDVSNDAELAIYTKRHGTGGKSYYSFDYRSCHFVVLDSIGAERKPPFADEMFDWLGKDLANASSAEHLFVFYHYPRMTDGDANEVGIRLWSRLLPMLPKDKTTIFNGHWHNMGAFDDGGVESYVLADTGADPVENPRELGGFRQFAMVSVESGKPTMAVLPVGEVRPISIAFDAEDFYKLTEAVKIPSLPMEGGTAQFTQTNPLDRPVSIRFQCTSAGWESTGAPPLIQLKPGQSQPVSFALKSNAALPERPSLTATYEFTNRAGKLLKSSHEYPVGVYTRLEIPIVKTMTVDGSLEDWKDIPALKIASADRVCGGRADWKGPEDESYEMRVATDGQRLFVAVRAWDDQICAQKDLKAPWNNDAVEFFWDVRPPEKRDGSREAGTGQIVLMLPDKGETLVPKVDAEKEPIKSDLKTALKFVAGGYVVEFSVPLKDLGMTQAAIAGEGINIELMLDDRDEKDGQVTHKFMTTGGTGRASENTSGYARGRFRE